MTRRSLANLDDAPITFHRPRPGVAEVLDANGTAIGVAEWSDLLGETGIVMLGGRRRVVNVITLPAATRTSAQAINELPDFGSQLVRMIGVLALVLLLGLAGNLAASPLRDRWWSAIDRSQNACDAGEGLAHARAGAIAAHHRDRRTASAHRQRPGQHGCARR